jgi:transposase
MINALRHGLPAALEELAQLGRTLWRRRADATSTTTPPTAY